MDRSLVIVNPMASRLRDANVRQGLIDAIATALERRDGREPLVVVTERQEDTRPAVEAGVAEGVGAVIGVGGDGTLRDIATILRGSGIPLGIVPGGTGNQVAAVLGIPRSLEDAAASLERATRRTVDLGEVTFDPADGPPSTSLFTIGCGLGLDARIMATTPSEWKQRLGRTSYLVQGMKLALSLEATPHTITIDGQTIETDATIALVGNMGQLIPGALDLRLPIEPDDGLLDLIVVGARGAIDGMRGLADQLWRTSLGGESGSDSVRARGRAIAVAGERPEPVQIDGDYVGMGSLSAAIIPGAIDVLVPGAKA